MLFPKGKGGILFGEDRRVWGGKSRKSTIGILPALQFEVCRPGWVAVEVLGLAATAATIQCIRELKTCM